MISIGKGNLVPHLIGQFPLQIHRLPLNRLVGEAVHLLQPEGAEYRRGLVPGHGQPGVEFILNVDFQAGDRRKIIRSIPSLQHHRIIAVGKGFRYPHGNPTVIFAGAYPTGDIAFIPVRQQMGGQHLPNVIIDTAQISGQIVGEMTVAGVQLQQPLKILFVFGPQDRI